MLEFNINLEGRTVLVTGAAGFIGAALVKRLFREQGRINIVGIDSITPYYDTAIKRRRLKEIESSLGEGQNWTFVEVSLSDTECLESVFEHHGVSLVVNLAAQAGVRYSSDNPAAFIESNIVGFFNILELCRRYRVEHLVYASSSSVYGCSGKLPYSTDDATNEPASLYAATKKSNELMAHAYARLYGIPSTGLRFFTVYGPDGRPDMAYYSFARDWHCGRSVKLFSSGECARDFTYIDDAVEAVFRVIRHAPSQHDVPCCVYNVGSGKSIKMKDFALLLRDSLASCGVIPSDFDAASHMVMMPMQPGDVMMTCADASALAEDFGFSPSTPLGEGLMAFALWYAGELSLDGSLCLEDDGREACDSDKAVN